MQDVLSCSEARTGNPEAAREVRISRDLTLNIATRDWLVSGLMASTITVRPSVRIIWSISKSWPEGIAFEALAGQYFLQHCRLGELNNERNQ